MLLVRKALEGTVLRTRLDTGYWLSAGYAETDFPALVVGSRVYRAPEGAAVVFVYEERVGQGRVIAFAEDVNFRGFWRGANRLFLNAVVVGPSGR